MKQKNQFLLKAARVAIAALVCTALAAPLAWAADGSPEEGQQLFQAKCAGCHSLGSGAMTGPDLAGVSQRRSEDFLRAVIVEPDKLFASDPTGAALDDQYGASMPSLAQLGPYDDDDVDSLLAFFKNAKPGAGAGPQLPPGQASRGRQLFSGELRLTNGGSACIACHNAGDVGPEGVGFLGGGTMAKDLADLYSRIKEPGVNAALKSLQFPVMKDIFAGRPLTDQEVADMTAFLKEVSREDASPGSMTAIFALAGVAGFVIILLLSQLIWRKRVHGIRRQLVGGSK